MQAADACLGRSLLQLFKIVTIHCQYVIEFGEIFIAKAPRTNISQHNTTATRCCLRAPIRGFADVVGVRACRIDPDTIGQACIHYYFTKYPLGRR